SVNMSSCDSLASTQYFSSFPTRRSSDLGTLIDLSSRGFPEEIWAPGRLARGAGIVCFSGDKLLGGPQAGIILARDAAVADGLRRDRKSTRLNSSHDQTSYADFCVNKKRK